MTASWRGWERSGKMKAYLRIPKVRTNVVGLLAKLQCNHFMHLKNYKLILLLKTEQTCGKNAKQDQAVRRELSPNTGVDDEKEKEK